MTVINSIMSHDDGQLIAIHWVVQIFLVHFPYAEYQSSSSIKDETKKKQEKKAKKKTKMRNKKIKIDNGQSDGNIKRFIHVYYT